MLGGKALRAQSSGRLTTLVWHSLVTDEEKKAESVFLQSHSLLYSCKSSRVLLNVIYLVFHWCSSESVCLFYSSLLVIPQIVLKLMD